MAQWPRSRICAASPLQGKFWEMHDTLYEHQTALDGPHLKHYAEKLGLDLDALKAALAGDL